MNWKEYFNIILKAWALLLATLFLAVWATKQSNHQDQARYIMKIQSPGFTFVLDTKEQKLYSALAIPYVDENQRREWRKFDIPVKEPGEWKVIGDGQVSQPASQDINPN